MQAPTALVISLLACVPAALSAQESRAKPSGGLLLQVGRGIPGQAYLDLTKLPAGGKTATVRRTQGTTGSRTTGSLSMAMTHSTAKTTWTTAFQFSVDKQSTHSASISTPPGAPVAPPIRIDVPLGMRVRLRLSYAMSVVGGKLGLSYELNSGKQAKFHATSATGFTTGKGYAFDVTAEQRSLFWFRVWASLPSNRTAGFSASGKMTFEVLEVDYNHYGQNCAPKGLKAPRLATARATSNKPFTSLRLSVSDAPRNAAVILAGSLAPAKIRLTPACDLLLDPATMQILGGARTGPRGQAQIWVGVPHNTPKGLKVYFQAATEDTTKGQRGLRLTAGRVVVVE